MSLKKVFSRFIGTVLVGMEKTVVGKSLTECEKAAFEWKWKKLGHVGAKGVAEHLQEKHGLGSLPTVVGDEEEPIPVFSVSHEKYRHEFEIGESRFRYSRVNGKAEEMFKEFSALTTEFWVEFHRKKGNIEKRGKAKKTKTRDDASYKISQQMQKEKKEAEKKEKEEAKRREKEAKKEEEKPSPETPPPHEKPSPETPTPETPSPETPMPEKPSPETPPPVTGEAASGEPLPKE